MFLRLHIIQDITRISVHKNNPMRAAVWIIRFIRRRGVSSVVSRSDFNFINLHSKNMKNIFCSLFTLSLIMLSGCGKDFLTRPPLNQVSATTYWETEEAAKMGVSAIYDALQEDRGYRLGMMTFGDIAGDGMACYE